MNLPPGTTLRDIDNLCRPDNSYPDRETCYLCNRDIEQDPDTRRWFDGDLGYKPYFRSDWLDSFQGPLGWICSKACEDEHSAEEPEPVGPEDDGEDIAAEQRLDLQRDEGIRSRLLLVKGGRA